MPHSDDILPTFGPAAATNSRSVAMSRHPMEFTRSVLSIVQGTESRE
jgi:hypothetical protein